MISDCEIASIVNDNSRFLSHLTIIHILTCVIDSNEQFLNSFYIRSMCFTFLAITIYHIFLKKIYAPVIQKTNDKCMKSLKKR